MRKYNLIMVVCIVAAVAIIISCKTTFETTKASYTAVKYPQSFERGKSLVYSICGSCHYNGPSGKFIGTRIEDVPAIVGKVYAANLTNSRSHGVTAHYSDAEIRYLLKTGVSRDGHFIPYMLRPNLAEEDIDAIIVYLRSNDQAVAAGDTTVGITHYNLIGKTFMNITAKPLAYRAGIKRPPENAPVALGAYLVDNIGCYHCHSKILTAINFLNPEQTKGYLAGGLKLKGENGTSVPASNITPDKLTGIGNYTKEEFRNAIKEGQAPNRRLRLPMPRFRQLSDSDADAIYAYLQTVPPKYHNVRRY